MQHVLLTTILLPLLVATLPAAEPDPPAYAPTSDYAKQEIRGWTVYVNRRLLTEHKETAEKALELLDTKLYDINPAFAANLDTISEM